MTLHSSSLSLSQRRWPRSSRSPPAGLRPPRHNPVLTSALLLSSRLSSSTPRSTCPSHLTAAATSPTASSPRGLSPSSRKAARPPHRQRPHSARHQFKTPATSPFLFRCHLISSSLSLSAATSSSSRRIPFLSPASRACSTCPPPGRLLCYHPQLAGGTRSSLTL